MAGVVPVLDGTKRLCSYGGQADGYLVYCMMLAHGLRPSLVRIGKLGKPTLVADEVFGGSGVA